MMAKGYEIGLGFLKNTAIDRRISARKRENDMAEEDRFDLKARAKLQAPLKE